MNRLIHWLSQRMPIVSSLDEQYAWRNQPFPQTRDEIEAELRKIARVISVRPPLRERKEKLEDMRTTLLLRMTVGEARALLAREPRNGVFFTGPRIGRRSFHERI